MSVGLRYLYGEIKKHGVELAAGISGLDNKVRWIHIVESDDIASFLQGGELVFTTGIGAKTDEELFELVKKTKDKGASGIIIYVGKFIREINESLLDYCDNNDYPLFVAPWGVNMSETMKGITIKIIESEKNYLEVANAVKDAIFLHNHEELYMPIFRRLGYTGKWKFIVSLIEIESINNEIYKVEDYTPDIIKLIEEELRVLRDEYISVNVMKSVILLFYNKSEEEVDKIIKNIYIKITKKFRNFHFYIGIEKESCKLEELYKGYEEAKKIAKINRLLRNDNINISPSEIGIYKLLLSIEDKNKIKQFYEETIGDLEAYDKLNDTDYVDLLNNFFENNCRVNETANALYIHRNTVKYKMKKIEEILDINLSDIGEKSKIYISLMIRYLI